MSCLFLFNTISIYIFYSFLIKHNNIYILHNNSNILYYRDDDTSLLSEIKSPSSFMSEIKLRSIHMNYLAQIAISFSLFQYTTKRVLIRKD